MTGETRVLNGVSKTLSYSYHLGGSLKSLTYPSGRTVTYTPDSAGRVVSARDGNGTQYVTSATYYASGAEYQRNMPGIYFRNDFNTRLQVSGFYSNNGQVGQSFLDKSYNYGALHQNNGNVMSIINNKDSSRTQTFAYDALNRIMSGSSAAASGALSWGENYGIDAWGNLMISPMGDKAHGGLFQHAGNVNNQATGLGYDAAGNLTNYTAPGQYVYDPENRIQSTAGVTYTYDADGNRVEKSGGSVSTLYWYGAPGIIAGSDLSGTLKSEYVFFNGKRLARIDLLAGTVHYYLSDHLNSTSMVISGAGAVEDESDYSPFGTEYALASSGLNHYKFTSKERDTESQLDYFGARYYSNGLGRFITPDWAAKASPVPYAELADPQSLNLYSYVRNIPTVRFDKDGHKDCSGSGANCTQVSQIQIKQTVNVYEDSKNPNKITGTVQVTTNITVVYGGGQQTSITASATATNIGDTHYSAAQLGTIGNTVAAVQADGLTKSLGSDPARLLTATVGRESTLGITAPTNPLQLSCSSGQCASRGDTSGNIDKAENILSDRVHSQHDDPARTYDRYNAAPDHVTNTQRFMNSYSTMQQGLAGTTYTGVPAPPVPDGLK